MILEADDQTCSTFEAESATPPDEAQIQPICTYFSQTMFANMDKLRTTRLKVTVGGTNIGQELANISSVTEQYLSISAVNQ